MSIGEISRKKIILGFSILSFSIFLIILLNWNKYPKKWDSVKIGMTEKDINEIPLKIDSSLRDIKGFDIISGLDDSKNWSMYISYSDSKVIRIEKKFTDKDFGVFNRTIITE